MISSRACFEIISVGLEIFAFFCVTLDLYGEERLKRRTQNLSSAMDSISTRIRRRVWEPFKERYEDLSRLIGRDGEAPPEAIFVVIASVLAVVFAAAFVFLLGKITDTGIFPPGVLKYVLIALTAAGLLVTGFIVAGYAFLALLISLRGLMSFGLYLLRRWQLRGVLLGVGVLLFLASKGIVIWNAFASLYTSK